MAKPGQNTTSGRAVLWCMILVLSVWSIFQLGSIPHRPTHEIESTESALDLPFQFDVVVEPSNVQDDDATAWLSSLLVERAPGDSVPGWYGLSTINLLDNNQQLTPRGKLVREGLVMRCMMIAPIGNPASSEHVPQSSYLNYDDLAGYGWQTDFANGIDFQSDAINKDTNFFAPLDVSSERTRWMSITSEHGGHGNWEPTEGEYVNYVNLQDGMIIATSSWSPAHMIKEHKWSIPPEKLVPLQRWSDVAWLGYNKWLSSNIAAGRPTKLLEHVVRHHVITPAVKAMLEDITGTTEAHIGLWPGRSYPILTSEALAILGTPHGKGVGWFLAQHKLYLGVRTVDRINVFNCPKQSTYTAVSNISIDNTYPTQFDPPNTLETPINIAAMARPTLQLHKTRVAALLLLVAITVCLLLLSPSTNDIDVAVNERNPDVDPLKHLSSHLLPRVDNEDKDWLGYPQEELNSRTGSRLGEKGQLAITGWGMLCKLMERPGPTENIPATPYTQYSDIKKYGYTDMSTSDFRDPTDTVDFSRYSMIGLSKADRDWKESSLKHSESTSRYPATGAVFECLMNVKYGAIIALDSQGPDHKNQEKRLGLRPDQIVPLKRWSDISWLEYDHLVQAAGKANVAPLQHVISHHITTKETQQRLKLVTGMQTPDQLGQFPGMSCSTNSPQGMALLATLHGKVMVWLLAQHKDSLGWRTIDRIHVYNCRSEKPALWCIYWHIVPVG
ncbi:hypothetical protein CBER1_10713 [Cercospora berteroae]|uniref:Uncharacterized protein n=1 Tax=Cercospora berteroae TaxID=357750 RepID=A0A2S6BYF5_9PEZI|nr:hypothetical protein CBER1_10713 [Cercospora berteroae]